VLPAALPPSIYTCLKEKRRLAKEKRKAEEKREAEREEIMAMTNGYKCIYHRSAG